ncbi:hypothetical protein EC988_008158 [Linderina pennispora]|nr:hypothetical protein EC988_008158 [Linderina pennispora]
MNALNFMLIVVLCLASYAQAAALPTSVGAATPSPRPVAGESATATVVVNIETNLSADLPRVLSEARELEKMVEMNGEPTAASAKAASARGPGEIEEFMSEI